MAYGSGSCTSARHILCYLLHSRVVTKHFVVVRVYEDNEAQIEPQSNY